jgi:hypothetical protein
VNLRSALVLSALALAGCEGDASAPAKTSASAKANASAKTGASPAANVPAKSAAPEAAPPKAPELSADQKGALGALTLGDKVFKAEGALVKRNPEEGMAEILLLPRVPTKEDIAAYRAGTFARLGKLGHVRILVWAGKDGFGSPPQVTQRKVVFKNVTGMLASQSFLMAASEFTLAGGLEVGDSLSLQAKGFTVDTFPKTKGRVVSWELDLEKVEVLSPTKG